MIVCHCNCITDKDIASATCDLVSRDFPTLPTPGSIYHQLGRRMRCATCLPVVAEIIAETVDRCSICPAAQVCLGRMNVANDTTPMEGTDEGQAGGHCCSE